MQVMNMRKKLISGNWKMFYTKAETKDYFKNNLDALCVRGKEVVFFVPYTDIDTAVWATKDSEVKIGAQNVHYEVSGAYTGEISCAMIAETGAQYILIGHSERRKYNAETDETVNKKISAVYASGLIPMVCVGENLTQRQSGAYLDVIASQLEKALAGINADARLVIAYEPVWAIGTGMTASGGQAEEVCASIRKSLGTMFGALSEKIRILYGGSVNAGNISELMAMENIDGVLVGGASLKPEFAKIVQYDK